jgi:hypothetical protein
MQPNASDHRFRSAVKYGWIRFVGAARPNGRFGLRRRPRGGKEQPIYPYFADMIDPVELMVVALTVLAPALNRANTTGKKVTVTVPDEQTGAIFRAALMQSQQFRATDRLVEIVTADGADEPDVAVPRRRPH